MKCIGVAAALPAHKLSWSLLSNLLAFAGGFVYRMAEMA